MKIKINIIIFIILSSSLIFSQENIEIKDTTKTEKEFDYTWAQGNDRKHSHVLESKYFSGTITFDANYNYSFNNPIDHTNSGSTATFRSNELNIPYIEGGGEFHDKNNHAKIILQFGTRVTAIPRNDLTPLRGQYDLYTAMRNIAEAYAGHHFNWWKGVNLDIGIFRSYVGLCSANNFENWNYQSSYTSDNTPWFFTGARMQAQVTSKLKVELWLISGWQTYAMFNNQPGFGFQIQYRPREWLSLVTNEYVGWDTPNSSSRIRVHSDNSITLRYRNRPGRSIPKAAFSFTGDLGFEEGDGVTAFGGSSGPAQNFASFMVYNRIWLGKKQRFAWTNGGGYMNNPGRYLALMPTGNAIVTQNPGEQLEGWDFTSGIQFMPTEYMTWGLEFVTRHMNTPYFSGHGGVTSPNGWNAPIGNPTGFVADLVRDENRIIASVIFRF